MKFARCKSGFTLVELLVVISILGILAGLAVPALKNLGKSNITVSASRQLLDDLARARQMAMSQRTTVYMVFVPTNFWVVSGSSIPNMWWNALSSATQTAVTNLCDKQLSGYTFIAHGSAGDQPGQHPWRYLAPWQNLPDGSFIALQKFTGTNTIVDPITQASYPIAQFYYTNDIPFPTATNVTGPLPSLAYVAFNYLGQLTFDGQTLATRDEYIPLAQGSVSPAINVPTKTFVLSGAPSVSETPAGNSTNITYNIIDIDPLTGRAVLRYHKMAP